MLKKKKGQAGNAVQYLTRNQALKKLQLKLSEFRRLCILKGIHPREPRKKTQGAHKTYYHVKDIAYLLHEPLLKKVRELSAYDKKVRKALAKKNKDLAKHLSNRRPEYRLDHLIRERYPSFVDALRDLDDPLTLIHLFAVLPADSTRAIPAERVQLSRQLALEWQAWVARAGALRKAFVSVKGFYFQAEVRGQAITWLVPHQTAQVLPVDVDFKVMLTFLELYQTTLQFVLYKLYTEAGLRYPPVVDAVVEGAAGGASSVLADGGSGSGHAAKKASVEKQGGRKKLTPSLGQQKGAVGNTKREANAPSGSGGGDSDDNENEDENEDDDVALDDEAAERLGSLSAKVAELEAEIQAMEHQKGGAKSNGGIRGRHASVEDDTAEDDDGDEDGEDDASVDDAELEIDSGDENVEAEEEEDSDVDDDEDDSEEGSEEGSEEEEAEEEEEEAEEDATATEHALSSVVVAPAEASLVGGAADVDADDDAALCSSLFRGLTFFLGREVPREQLLLVVRAFGGRAGWAGEGSPYEESDSRITHQIIDRPAIPQRVENREYVQPQWVFDSANARVLVRTEKYRPGTAPPPHLSPFVDAEAEGYEPEYAKEIKQLQEAARKARKRAAGTFAEDAFLKDGAEGGTAKDGDVNDDDDDEARLEHKYVEEIVKELGGSEKMEKQEEAKIAAGGGNEETKSGGGGTAAKRRRVDGEEGGMDEEAMKDIMMTRKVRRAYQKAKAEESAKRERAEKLEARAVALKRSKQRR